ncbi:hypothetical protein B0H10DRAFT_1939230 [Mycena sp. CBHHK59/15]|nr:hypothetical protein B0H10DRAFT_1939230 [Mycena sp. CBHHK59/15]
MSVRARTTRRTHASVRGAHREGMRAKDPDPACKSTPDGHPTRTSRACHSSRATHARARAHHPICHDRQPTARERGDERVQRARRWPEPRAHVLAHRGHAVCAERCRGCDEEPREQARVRRRRARGGNAGGTSEGCAVSVKERNLRLEGKSKKSKARWRPPLANGEHRSASVSVLPTCAPPPPACCMPIRRLPLVCQWCHRESGPRPHSQNIARQEKNGRALQVRDRLADESLSVGLCRAQRIRGDLERKIFRE